MNVKHKHLIVRAEVSNTPTKGEMYQILEWMENLIKKINMKLMHAPSISYVDQKGNRGITCMALIETSHIVLHIWDENNPGLFQLDIYSCKDIEIDLVIDYFKNSFNVEKLQYKFLDRENDLTLVDQD
ncbi:MAG: S-adenosylmethionine decarboxylase [Pseudomonadota bacterium]|nr:S-adenosylmethionine decarboxylase [Pseudomonadota bacterium]MEC8996339.1 S-adenosylmethionine decarboxylase [Pseudomonadota bacterium]|tara:strand:- start:4632 stop:5015 length:384 start_codon:yes stop_codon:yes gene_type:complete